jgi:hypothetical protein
MISIKAEFDLAALDRFVQEQTDQWLDSLMEKYRKAGLQFVERARSKTKAADGSFGNITWNLRSSIGYLLMRDGKVIESYFPTLQGAPEGSVTGDAYARQIATSNEFDQGIALICVAGMEYAYYVEAKGYDVISGSSDHFDTELTSLLFNGQG